MFFRRNLEINDLLLKSFCIFAPAFRKECKDILLNSLTITTREKSKLSLLGLFRYGRSFPIFESGLW